jgi:hypothetical protein
MKAIRNHATPGSKTRALSHSLATFLHLHWYLKDHFPQDDMDKFRKMVVYAVDYMRKNSRVREPKSFFFLVVVVLQFELGVSHLLGRHSTA